MGLYPKMELIVGLDFMVVSHGSLVADQNLIGEILLLGLHMIIILLPLIQKQGTVYQIMIHHHHSQQDSLLQDQQLT